MSVAPNLVQGLLCAAYVSYDEACLRTSIHTYVGAQMCVQESGRTRAMSVSHSSGVRKPLRKVERGFQLSSSISPYHRACAREHYLATALSHYFQCGCETHLQQLASMSPACL